MLVWTRRRHALSRVLLQRLVGGADFCRNHFQERNNQPRRFYCKASGTAKKTPAKQKQSLYRQFQQIKNQYKDFILLFQVGDFYEIYDEDASAVADKTSLRITKHGGANLMAGFPKKSLAEWSRVLVKAGFQLAVCNQTPGRYEFCILKLVP